MFSYTHSIRIHYALTDKMGVVYHSRYLELFEIARTEAIRYLGLSYAQIEEQGILMPVTDVQVKYLRPVAYDDLLKIKVSINEQEKRKVTFNYEAYVTEGKLCCTAKISLVFINAETKKTIDSPEIFAQVLKKYF